MRFLLVLALCISTAWAQSEPSVLLYNSITDQYLIAKNHNEIRPLASITKLMTAIVSLETGYDLDRKLALHKRWGGVLPLRSYSRRELLTAMLIRSDNSAAETLAQDYPGGRQEFIQAMNDRAQSLGMISTRFEDASGLSAANISSARDILLLLTAAAQWTLIRDMTTTQHTEIVIPQTKKPIKLTINNTNSPLLGTLGSSTIIGKTGLTSKAGWCVAMTLEENQQRYHVIVLGAKSKKQRTELVENLVQFIPKS